MAYLKYKDKSGVWQYVPCLKYKNESDVFQITRSIKYKDANGIWQKAHCYDPKSSNNDDYPTISTLTVGSSVYLNENGTAVEYLLVQNGLPDETLYDSSCDGMWLLRKDCCDKTTWDSTDNDYENSDIHAYLNGTFLGSFDTDVQKIIKQVKVPYRKGSGRSNTVTGGADGLLTKVFLPSLRELNVYTVSQDGSVLDYFINASNTVNAFDDLRVANYQGSAVKWWVRTPYCETNTYTEKTCVYISEGGTSGVNNCYLTNHFRPIVILPHTAKLDPNTNIIIG